MAIRYCGQYLEHDLSSNALGDAAKGKDFVEEFATFAVLGYQVEKAFVLGELVESDNIGVILRNYMECCTSCLRTSISFTMFSTST